MARGVYIRTAEARKNMSLAHVGQTAWNKGQELSPEHIEKLRSAKLGKPRAGNPENWKHTEETKAKVSEAVQLAFDEGRLTVWNKGKTGYTTQPHSDETKKKIGIANSRPHPWAQGENNHKWKGGITPINTKIRNSTEYRDWRIAVFERDNYTCQECGSRGVTLNADHIKPFAYYPELRLCIDNGRTLCVPCHKETDTYLWKAAPQNKNVKI